MEVKEIISSGLLELYCLGMASPTEASEVLAWAKQYPEVAAEIAAIEKGIKGYADIHAIAPDPVVKEKLFSSLGIEEKKQAEIHSFSPYWKMVAAAAVLLLIGSTVLNIVFYNKYNTASKGLEETQEELAMEKKHANEMLSDMAIVQDPNSVPVSLKEMTPSSGTNARIFWMKNTGEVMIDVSNLPDAPAGKQYQFWAIVDGVPVNGGMIITNGKGKKFRMQRMRSFGRAQAFAISLEKEGGNPTPTAVVSMGKII